jgi:hypothetical protein
MAVAHSEVEDGTRFGLCATPIAGQPGRLRSRRVNGCQPVQPFARRGERRNPEVEGAAAVEWVSVVAS